MYIEQLYTGCLSEAAYYVESNGEAAIIDPMRDIEPYLQLAKERNTSIKYIFETHFHADFVSGHLELSAASAAPIIYGPTTETSFKAHVAKDSENFQLGNINIQAVHTPGHTLESTCYLVKDEYKKDYAVFTGDTLFVGDVGRPDLAQKGNELTTEDLAGMLYDSLQNKILTLADEVIVYPAHGAGSSCGKNLGKETFSTIGNERLHNYALQSQSKEEFIQSVTEGLTQPPQYFPENVRINKEGYTSLNEIMNTGLQALNTKEFKAKMDDEDTLVLDTRSTDEFTLGFVPGSIFIGLNGRFAEWAGSLLPFNKNLLLVCQEGKEEETIIRLARVGFDKIKGYLKGGFISWIDAGEEADMIINVEPDELAMDIPFDNNLVIVDVRKEAEFNDGHIKDALNIPLSDMIDPASMTNLEEEQNIYVHCGSGYRSVIACSLMKNQGIHNLRNVLGGWNAIKEESKLETEKNVQALN